METVLTAPRYAFQAYFPRESFNSPSAPSSQHQLPCLGLLPLLPQATATFLETDIVAEASLHPRLSFSAPSIPEKRQQLHRGASKQPRTPTFNRLHSERRREKNAIIIGMGYGRSDHLKSWRRAERGRMVSLVAQAAHAHVVGRTKVNHPAD